MKRIATVLASLMLLVGCYEKGREPGDDPSRTDETPGEGRPVDPTQKPVAQDAPTTLDRAPIAQQGTDDSHKSEPKKP
jgi:PBP1b-binding outer membrane lipoprotein LpoB